MFGERQEAGALGIEHAKLWRDPSFGGVDLLNAHFTTHCFGRHAHDEFVIAIFEQGAERFKALGSTHVANAGAVLIIPPGVVHTGSAASSAGWTYRAFYPGPRPFTELCTRVLGASSRPMWPSFQQIRDAKLHSALLAAHRDFETGAPLLQRESRMLDAFACLLTRLEHLKLRRPGYEASAIKQVIEYMEEYFADDIGIDQLAGVARLSASYLMRSFQRHVGTSIHAYLTRVRLRHTRERLVRGEPPSQIAHSVGFVDQSHLIRHFKRVYGATPGSYVHNTRNLTKRTGVGTL